MIYLLGDLLFLSSAWISSFNFFFFYMQGYRLLQLKNPWSHLRWKVCTSPYQSQLFVECFCKQNVGKISRPDWLRQRHPNFDCWDQIRSLFLHSMRFAGKGKRILYLNSLNISWNQVIMILQGKFSEIDSTSWTPELQRALNYDRKSAIQIDNGKNVEHCMSLSVPLSSPWERQVRLPTLPFSD